MITFAPPQNLLQNLFMMKKLFFFAAAILVGAFALTSCSGGSPKGVAEKYLTSFYRMNYEDAKKYATEETKKQLDMLNQFAGMMGDTAKQQAKNAVVNVTDVKEDGNNATVTYTLKPDGKEQAPGTQTLKMVKEGGKWLASWSKQDMMGGMGGQDPNAAPMNDPNASMPMDTTTPMVTEPMPTDTAMAPTR